MADISRRIFVRQTSLLGVSIITGCSTLTSGGKVAGTKRHVAEVGFFTDLSYPDGKREVIKSSMLDFGTLATDTAVARTVALPAAVGVEMILNNEIEVKGVHIPVIPAIYNPILDALEKMNIRMVEEFGLPESDIIK